MMRTHPGSGRPTIVVRSLVTLATVLSLAGLAAAKSPLDRVEQELLGGWDRELRRVEATIGSLSRARHPEPLTAKLHVLYVEAVEVLKLVSERQLPAELERRIIRRLQDLELVSGGLQAEMSRRLHARNPGGAGATLVRRTAGEAVAFDRYHPSYKSPTLLPAREQRRALAKARAEHAAAHPGQRPYRPLDRALLASARSGEVLEWVALGKPERPIIRVTRDAKHVVVANGNPVLASGGLLVHRDAAERLVAVELSNWSGTYQAELGAADYTVGVRLQRLRVPRDRIVFRTAMPGGYLKLYENLRQLCAPAREGDVSKQTLKAGSQAIAEVAKRRVERQRPGWSAAAARYAARTTDPARR